MLPADRQQHKSIVLALVLISVLFLCDDAMAATISGTIRDSESGKPVPSTTVHLVEPSLYIMADRSGRYELKNVSVGKRTIEFKSVAHELISITISVEHASDVIVRDVSLVPAVMSAPELTITARANKETAASARMTEKSAPTVVTVLSAEEIAHYPDPSTAESMQRVSGVSITRVRGEARNVIVRGMSARYNSVLIDGMRSPTPSTTTRDLQLDFLPSELLQRVEVTKSLTPDMEGDAIGGAVNLVMRTAPEHFLLRTRLGTGYANKLVDANYLGFNTDSIFDDPLERFGANYQAKPTDFPHDNLKLVKHSVYPDLLGDVTIGDRILDGKLGILLSGSVQKIYRYSETIHNYDAIDVDNNEYLISRQFRLHSHDKTRWGLNSKVDYIVNASNEISASFTGFIRHNIESRVLADSNFVHQPVLYQKERSVVQTYTLSSISVTGDHKLSDFDLHWRAARLEATQQKPDRAELATVAELRNGVVVSQPVFYSVVRDWQHNDDRDYVGSIDIDWNGLRQSINTTFKAGLFARTKSRDNYQNTYVMAPLTDSAGNLPPYTGVDELTWEVLNLGGTPQYGSNNYTCTELVSAGYLMARWEHGPWNVLLGARIEATDGKYETYDVTQLAHVTSRHSYLDVLPSLHLRYALTPEQNLRFSLGRSISRPNYYDLVPYNIQGEDDREIGNPSLRRSISTNVDLRWEYYITSDEAISFGPFYKRIQDPIETAVDLSNPALPSIQSRNFGAADLYGAEITGNMALPLSLRLQATYTWTHSAITADKILFNKETGKTLLVPETRPLQGQSEHVANIALAFDNKSGSGTFAQISLVFTGRRISHVSLYKDLNDYQLDYPILDASFEQEIGNGFSTFLYLNNLLNTNYRIESQRGTLIEEEAFGLTGTIGVTWHY